MFLTISLSSISFVSAFIKDNDATKDAQPVHASHGSATGNLSAVVSVEEIDYHWTTNVSLGGQLVRLCVDTGSSPL